MELIYVRNDGNGDVTAKVKILIEASVEENGKFFLLGEFEGNMKDAVKISKILEIAQFLKEGFGTMDDKI